MAQIDISLLGKRYPELNEALFVSETDIFAIYKDGSPELDRISWVNIQKSFEIKNSKDLIGIALSNNDFLRYSTSLGKFTKGTISLNDIPNLPTSQITSGTFVLDRIPELPISQITNLSNELASKEPLFLKGDIVSSTLTLTGNTGRLFGAGNLGIEFNVNSISGLFAPMNRNLTFISTNEQMKINGLSQVSFDLSENRFIEFDVSIEQYVHPSGFDTLPIGTPLLGAFVISQLNVTNEGHVEDIQIRELTKFDLALGEVDNTSDLNKPISSLTQEAIDDLDDRFLRKDANDNNGIFTLSLGGLNVQNLTDELTPNYTLVVMNDGTVRRSNYIGLSDIANLQDQIDNIFVGNLPTDWMYIVRPVQLSYPTNEAMRLDQNRQVSGFIYYSEQTGSFYHKLSTFNNSLVDYQVFGGLTNITLTGDVTGSGGDFISTTISANAITTPKVLNSSITYEKIQNVGANRILGRIGTEGLVQELNPTQVLDLLDVDAIISSVNNRVGTVYIDPVNLSGIGSEIQQICDWINSNVSVSYTKEFSKINYILQSSSSNTGFPYTLPLILS